MNIIYFALLYMLEVSYILITLRIISIYKYYGCMRNVVFIHRILSEHCATLSPHKSSLPFCIQFFRIRNIFITKVVYIILYTLYIYRYAFFVVLVFYVRHFYIILSGRWNLIIIRGQTGPHDNNNNELLLWGSFVFHHHNNVITSPTLPGPIFLQNLFNVSRHSSSNLHVKFQSGFNLRYFLTPYTFYEFTF